MVALADFVAPKATREILHHLPVCSTFKASEAYQILVSTVSCRIHGDNVFFPIMF